MKYNIQNKFTHHIYNDMVFDSYESCAAFIGSRFLNVYEDIMGRTNYFPDVIWIPWPI